MSAAPTKVALALVVVFAVVPAGATAGSTAAAGSATTANVTASTATALPAPANATVTSGLPLCDGMFAYFETQNPEEDAGKTYEIASAGGAIPGFSAKEKTVNSEGFFVVNTTDIGTGDFVIQDEDGNSVVVNRSGKAVGTGNESQAAWSVKDCTLEAGFDRSSVTVEDDDEPSTATIDVTASNDSAVYVTNDRLSTDTLAELIDGGSATSKGVEVPLDGDGVQVEFPGPLECFTGEYTFRVRGTSTDASAPAFIDVERGPDDTKFRNDRIRVEQGGTTEIPVRVDRCDVRDGGDVRLRLGGGGSGYEATVTFTTDGEAKPNVVVDTSKAESGPASALFPRIERGSFVERRIVRDNQEPALQPTKYDLVLIADGTVVGTGTLIVERRETATPSPTATATPSPTPRPPDATPTPIGTPEPTETPPPGTPSATSRPVQTVSASPTASETAGGQGDGSDGEPDSTPTEPRTVVGPGVGIVVAGAIIAYALLRSQF